MSSEDLLAEALWKPTLSEAQDDTQPRQISVVTMDGFDELPREVRDLLNEHFTTGPFECRQLLKAVQDHGLDKVLAVMRSKL